MLKVISLNTQAGQLWENGLKQFYEENAKDTDVFLLQEVHRSYGASTAYMVPTRGYKQTMFVDQFDCLKSLMSDFDGYYLPTVKDALHDWNPIDEPVDYGIAMFVRKSVKVTGVATCFVNKHFGFMGNGLGESAARNAQAVTLIKDRTAYIFSHFHGLWNGMGKTDCRDRQVQTINVNRFLLEVCGQCRNDTKLEPRVVLMGDFNLTSDSKAFQGLVRGLAFGPSGAQDLNKKFGIKDTRTCLYEKPGREADYALVSDNVRILSYEVPSNPIISDHRPLILRCE